MENTKIQKFKCNILSNFQTMCPCGSAHLVFCKECYGIYSNLFLMRLFFFALTSSSASISRPLGGGAASKTRLTAAVVLLRKTQQLLTAMFYYTKAKKGTLGVKLNYHPSPLILQHALQSSERQNYQEVPLLTLQSTTSADSHLVQL